jgi:hypothetical protein
MLAADNAQRPRWSAIGLPGHAGESEDPIDYTAIERIRIPQAFVSHLYSLLAPGTTILITDAPVLDHTTGPVLSVMRSGLPTKTELL